MEIAEVEGIGAAHASSLDAAGVRARLTTVFRRDEHLASRTGIREPLLRTWVNRIDLALLEGIGPAYASLLQAAGVDCCAELARRDADHLAATMADLVATRATVRRAPGAHEIALWIDQARARAAEVEQ